MFRYYNLIKQGNLLKLNKSQKLVFVLKFWLIELNHNLNLKANFTAQIRQFWQVQHFLPYFEFLAYIDLRNRTSTRQFYTVYE
jgi:hypothetical protein